MAELKIEKEFEQRKDPSETRGCARCGKEIPAGCQFYVRRKDSILREAAKRIRTLSKKPLKNVRLCADCYKTIREAEQTINANKKVPEPLLKKFEKVEKENADENTDVWVCPYCLHTIEVTPAGLDSLAYAGSEHMRNDHNVGFKEIVEETSKIYSRIEKQGGDL